MADGNTGKNLDGVLCLFGKEKQVLFELMSIPVPWEPPPPLDSSTSSSSPGYFEGVVSEADPLVLYKATPWNALGHSRDSRLRIPRPVLLKNGMKPMICKRQKNSVLSFQGGTYSDFWVFQGGTTQDFRASFIGNIV